MLNLEYNKNMDKTSLPNNYNRRNNMGKKFDFEFTPLTFEQLKEMSQQELQQQIMKFRRMIKEGTASGVNTLPFETEYCYLDHEKQMRFRDNKSGMSSRNYRR